MGAKLSKKKKGYCLGAGKDGESTETTEVEQKETENQEGQKDAAEPKGEKTSTDQSQNNGINEEKDKTSEEVTSGETTKDSNKDQKSEIKSNTEEEKIEEKDQSRSKGEHVEEKPAASEQVCQEKKVKSPSEDKAKTETEVKEAPKTEDKVKEAPSVAADKPTQESKPASEKEDSKLTEDTVSEPSATIFEEELLKTVSESIMKVVMENTEKASPLVETAEHVSDAIAEELTHTKESEEPEKSKKVPEKMEPPAPESVPIVSASLQPEVPEVQGSVNIEVVEPEKIDLSEPVTVAEVQSLKAAVGLVESVLLEPTAAQNLPECTSSESVSELVKPLPKEPDLVPESEPAPKPEEPVLPDAMPEIPEIKSMEVTVPEHDAAFPGEVNEGTQDQGILSEPLPPKSNEVPDQTGDAQEEPENQELLGCEQGKDMETFQAAAIEAFPKMQQPETSEVQNDSQNPHVIQDRSSKHSADEQAEVQHGSTAMTVEDKGEENDEKNSTGQESHEVKEVLEMSNNENHKTGSQDTSEIPKPTPHYNAEEKTENDKISEENKQSAPEIIDQHGVGNGLPIKQEIKVHLENGSDKGLHNGQSESQEIQVCNE